MRHKPLSPKYLLTSLAILLVTLLTLTYITYLSLVSPVDPKSDAMLPFTINPGESTLAIANRLHTAGLIRSVFGFRLEVKRLGLAGKLQAGDYQVSAAHSASSIAATLSQGYRTQLKLTIPEGYRLEEVAAKVEAVLGIPSQEFLSQAKGFEGYLFPDTYLFNQGTTAKQVVERMKAEFTSKTQELKPSESQVILASLIERETGTDIEKPLVAGILQKRLQNNWPLELDATIQYIAGNKSEWWPNTTLLDRERKSPYNTYLNPGLPPGPICNPGLNSLKAAVSPQQSDYWFYLHDREGVIHYAATNSEHTANIAKYIR